jgi:pyruvate/2-oxoglutarate dehydrogenase complex dihydrolipoamide dehydrogenase (E3) component
MKTEQKSQQHYQLAVIGSGSGGRAAALLAGRKGLSTGYGELLDHRTVAVTGGKGTNVTFTADSVIVATGSRPEFHGSSEPKLVNSEELLRTPTVPEKLMIVGAGYIGCEFASIYRTLGCAVTIIEQKDRVLPGWEPEAGERVAQALLSQGVALLLNQHVTLGQIERNADAVRFRQPRGEAVEADLVLMATGRKANSGGMGLGALGIDDSSYLKVDKQMRLPVPGLYAVVVRSFKQGMDSRTIKIKTKLF